jgi:PAP2 superfamily
LTWILLGTVLAQLVPSAGPAYYQRVTGSWGPFAPLMTYLRAAGEIHQLDVLSVQTALWRAVERGEVVFGGGISAFPSLHVAMPVLGACAAWSTHRRLAWTFVAFGALIFLGSIHLGWHYALDGEAAVAGVAAIWWTTGQVGPVRPESDLPQGNASATPRSTRIPAKRV